MKKLLALILPAMLRIALQAGLILALAAATQAGNVVVTNPGSQPVPVTSVAKIGTAAIATNTAYSTHVTTNTTVTPVASTAYVYTVQVAVSNAGSAWVIKIQSKEGTPKILYTATAAVGSTMVITAEVPIGLTSGIDIITSGTTPGVADIWITYSQ